MSTLPTPSLEAQKHSQHLVDLICNYIEKSGGWISFEQFMQLALYAPSLGYYSAGSKKFGAGGDFVTAPEISPLFAKQVGCVTTNDPNPTGGRFSMVAVCTLTQPCPSIT